MLLCSRLVLTLKEQGAGGERRADHHQLSVSLSCLPVQQVSMVLPWPYASASTSSSSVTSTSSEENFRARAS